jgi:hypothetical protein
VELGLHEKRTGIVCVSAHSAFSGDTLWEEKHPDAADTLWALAQSHSQQASTVLLNAAVRSGVEGELNALQQNHYANVVGRPLRLERNPRQGRIEAYKPKCFVSTHSIFSNDQKSNA